MEEMHSNLRSKKGSNQKNLIIDSRDSVRGAWILRCPDGTVVRTREPITKTNPANE
jgi:hypothetical protein